LLLTFHLSPSSKSDRAPIWHHDGFVDRDDTNAGMRLGMVALIATEEQNLAALISSGTTRRYCQTEGEPSSTPT
jgi:hypothetical protein